MKTFLLLLAFASLSPFCEPKNIDLLPNPSIKYQQQNALAIEAIFGMGVRLQALLKDDVYAKKNFIVSPISATTIIAQLLLGSEGEFSSQLYDLLSLPKINQNATLNVYNNANNESYSLPYSTLHLQLASVLKNVQTRRESGKMFTLLQHSAVFVNREVQLKRRFRRQLSKLYDTQTYSMDFKTNGTQSREIINNWGAKHTNGLIKNILSAAPDATTMALFMNAIYFAGEWETPFSYELNNNGTFAISDNKTVQATYMMGNIERILYGETDSFRVICLPYKNDELGMYVLLPNETNANKYNMRLFAQSLDSKEIVAAINSAKLRDVIVKIPKLKLSNTISILEPLKKYKEFKKDAEQSVNGTNILDVLKDKVDQFNNFTSTGNEEIFLTNAAEGEKLHVSNIVQELVLNINEKGTEAAAISAAVMDYIDSSETFVVDRPFLFFIRHKETLATLFWGTVSDPTSN